MELDPAILDALRESRPETPEALYDWVRLYTGVKIAREWVCNPDRRPGGHTPPWEMFRCWQFDMPSQAAAIGPRGGGKSFLSALDTHLKSRFEPHFGTRILGGSLAQSRQIRNALVEQVQDGCGPFGWDDSGSIDRLTVQHARYVNGSEVEIIPASPRSVRGPHVPSLKLDEIDEMDPGIRESAVGMAVERSIRGFRSDGLYGETGEHQKSTILMTSTWHRYGGPMTKVMEDAQARDAERPGSFPHHTFCTFEVLERCPVSRSGPHVGGEARYANCPECPIRPYCHDTCDEIPKAKRSNGHVTIDSLIQKVMVLSDRAFKADYLCSGPTVEGTYFPTFTDANVTPEAEYDPGRPVWVCNDPGVHNGTVWFQCSSAIHRGRSVHTVNVFADYYAENVAAESVAREIVRHGETHCNGRREHAYMDPSGDDRNAVGASVAAEYARGGFGSLRRWSKPPGSVRDGLVLIEGLVCSADGFRGLTVHPRCKHLIHAMQGFRRKKRAGQWEDEPEDPQHPHEDLIEPLRGGLRMAFPKGRAEPDRRPRVPASRFT